MSGSYLQVLLTPLLRLSGTTASGTPPREIEGPHMRSYPIFKLLAECGFRVGVIARPQHSDKDLGITDLARAWIDDIYGLAGIIDKEFFASPVLMAHHHIQPGGPLSIPLTKPAVLVAVWVLLLVLLP